jgi:hypothetical protein
MKKLITPLLCLVAALILGSGCVTRTTMHGTPNKDGSKYGSKSSQTVKEQKRIWIRQKEFRNSQ